MILEFFALVVVASVAIITQFVSSQMWIGFAPRSIFVYATEIGIVYIISIGLLYEVAANTVLIGLVVGTFLGWFYRKWLVPRFLVPLQEQNLDPYDPDQPTFVGGTEPPRYRPGQYFDERV